MTENYVNKQSLKVVENRENKDVHMHDIRTKKKCRWLSPTNMESDVLIQPKSIFNAWFFY